MAKNKVAGLLQKFASVCAFCSHHVMVLTPTEPLHATVDHDIPKARGGTNDPENLLLACVRCNATKGDMTGKEFREFLTTRKLPSSYVDYLAERIMKMFNGRAPIVVHESVSLNVVAAGLYTNGSVAETRKIVAGWEKARATTRL